MKSSAFRLVGAILAASQLFGCIGGGGDGGDGTPPVVIVPKIVIALADKDTAAPVTGISPTAPAIATATVTDSAGAPVSGAIVTFTIGNSTLATLNPGSGTKLSDANGRATMEISTASIAGVGATSITAASSIPKTTTTTTAVAVSETVNFSVGAANVGLANLSNGLAAGASLSPYSTTTISATVTGVPPSTNLAVSFSSICSKSGKASLPATVDSINGVATATYTDNACAGQDTITVGIVGTTVSQTIALNVGQPVATSIQFVSATPRTIGIISVGNPNQPVSSTVSFKVVDNLGKPVQAVPVILDLSTRIGGILLNGAASGTVTQITDAVGAVSVQVTSGTLPTPVSVTATATVGGQTLTSQSSLLTITTGRPAQDRTSLAVKTHNIEGLNFFGTTTSVSISLADRLGNPVPDGTAVNFIADGALIDAQCTTAAGRCAATFTSANTQGAGKTEPAGIVTAGRVKVLAWAVGEESFKDYSVTGAATNDNNLYDIGEPFNDLGDVYLNSNESPQYDPGETTLPSGNSLRCDSGITNSPLAPSRANTCDGVWGTAYVRQDATIILSGSYAYIGATRPTGATVPGKSATSVISMGGGVSPVAPTSCNVTHTFWAYDINKNPLPAGTTIKVLAGYPTTVTPTISPAVVPDSLTPGGTPHSFNISIPLNATTGLCDKPLMTATSFRFEFSTPLAQISTVTFTVNP
jgi:hypothetical protein